MSKTKLSHSPWYPTTNRSTSS